MKIKILLTIYILLLLIVQNLDAQVLADTTKVIKVSENTVEFRNFVYGKFDVLKGMNQGQKINYLNNNYYFGTVFTEGRGQELNSFEFKPSNFWFFKSKDNNTIDTLAFKTTITNFKELEFATYSTYFRPKGSFGVIYLTGEEQIGKLVRNKTCYPFVEDISIVNDSASIGDTVTVVGNCYVEEDCSRPGDTLKFVWQKSDPVYDVVNSDSIVAYNEWTNFGPSWSIVLEHKSDKLVWVANNKNKDNWKFRQRAWNFNGEIFSNEILFKFN